MLLIFLKVSGDKVNNINKMGESEMKLLKITQQGLIDITNTNKISYNRTAIMKEGWKLKKEGHKDGIAQAWKKAKTQMHNLKELITETELERECYLEDYWMATEVAGDFLDDDTIKNEAMKDAIHDYKKLLDVMDKMGMFEEDKKIDKIYEDLESEFNKKSFKQIQKERLERLLEVM